MIDFLSSFLSWFFDFFQYDFFQSIVIIVSFGFVLCVPFLIIRSKYIQ